jgi:hypothetical protein
MFDADNYYSSESFKKDKEAYEAKLKAEEQIKQIKEQNRKAELAEQRSF